MTNPLRRTTLALPIDVHIADIEWDEPTHLKDKSRCATDLDIGEQSRDADTDGDCDTSARVTDPGYC